jgi:hypothetical protein
MHMDLALGRRVYTNGNLTTRPRVDATGRDPRPRCRCRLVSATRDVLQPWERQTCLFSHAFAVS